MLCNDILDIIEAKKCWQRKHKIKSEYIYLTQNVINILKRNINAFRNYKDLDQVMGLKVINVDNYKQISFSKYDIFIHSRYLTCNKKMLRFVLDLPIGYLDGVRKIDYKIESGEIVCQE